MQPKSPTARYSSYSTMLFPGPFRSATAGRALHLVVRGRRRGELAARSRWRRRRPGGCARLCSRTGAPVPPSVAHTIARVEAKARSCTRPWGLFVANAEPGRRWFREICRTVHAELDTHLQAPLSCTLRGGLSLQDACLSQRKRSSWRAARQSGARRIWRLQLRLARSAKQDAAYNSAPQLDHSDADGAPGPTLVPHSNPLAGVEQLARQVRAAGIREVDGNVVIDDRLFNTYSGWPDGVMSPIGIDGSVGLDAGSGRGAWRCAGSRMRREVGRRSRRASGPFWACAGTASRRRPHAEHLDSPADLASSWR